MGNSGDTLHNKSEQKQTASVAGGELITSPPVRLRLFINHEQGH